MYTKDFRKGMRQIVESGWVNMVYWKESIRKRNEEEVYGRTYYRLESLLVSIYENQLRPL
jgi:hypothetical protein